MSPLPSHRLADRADRCPVCNRIIRPIEAQLQRTCGGWKCQLRYARMQIELRRERNEPFSQQYRQCLDQATMLRDTLAAARGIEDPQLFDVLITPANERPLVTLPRRRRYRFVQRLTRLVEETLCELPTGQEATECQDSEQAVSILEVACANCLGHCCVRGGTRAYLDRYTIRRFIIRNQNAASREVVEAYYRRLPGESYRNSCVFHSAAGCNLPRDMRSNTCLNTVCGGLIELRQRIELDGATRFFLAAANMNTMVRTSFEVYQSDASRT